LSKTKHIDLIATPCRKFIRELSRSSPDYSHLISRQWIAQPLGSIDYQCSPELGLVSLSNNEPIHNEECSLFVDHFATNDVFSVYVPFYQQNSVFKEV
jgi:hypothetical protein